MSTTERAPIDFTEQSIKALKHEIENPYTHGRGRPYIDLGLDDARLILAELERLRASQQAGHDCVYRLSWDTLAYQIGPDNATHEQMRVIGEQHGATSRYLP